MTRNEIALACMGAATQAVMAGNDFKSAYDENLIVEVAFELADTFIEHARKTKYVNPEVDVFA